MYPDGQKAALRPRNGNRWSGAVTWTDRDGPRHRRMVSSRTSDEARDKLDSLRRDLRLGMLTSTDPATVGEYLTGWIERHRARVRPSTWLTAESYVRVYLIPALGRKPLPRLTAADVETALAASSGTAGPSPRPTSASDHRSPPSAPVPSSRSHLPVR